MKISNPKYQMVSFPLRLGIIFIFNLAIFQIKINKRLIKTKNLILYMHSKYKKAHMNFTSAIYSQYIICMN